MRGTREVRERSVVFIANQIGQILASGYYTLKNTVQSRKLIGAFTWQIYFAEKTTILIETLSFEATHPAKHF